MKFMHGVICFLISVMGYGSCEGLSDDIYIYMDIPEGAAGYRIMNGSSQFGFHTHESDAMGVLVILRENITGISECWRNRFEGYEGKYYVMMDISMLNGFTVDLIRHSDCISGLLLTDNAQLSSTSALSHDSVCPNLNSGYYVDGCDKNAWNARGAITREGLRDIDWNIQIAYVKSLKKDDLRSIERCYSLFNEPSSGKMSVSHPFCAVYFGVFNDAAGSSEICYRRSQKGSRLLELTVDTKSASLCHPLIGFNLYAFLPPRIYDGKAPSNIAKYLVLASRLDSFGLIPEISPGEISVVSSVIVLLAVSHTIGHNIEIFSKATTASNRHLIITFFDGESFDYIGSSHMAYEIMNDRFPGALNKKLKLQLDPIQFSQIEGIIEAQHVGIGKNNSLYAIVDSDQLKHKKKEINFLYSSLKDGVGKESISLVGERMPPSSWHSFAKMSIPGLVLSTFRDEYNYKRTNSILDRNSWSFEDRERAIHQLFIAAGAMLRVAADHVRIPNFDKEKLSIDHSFVSSMFDCFITSEDWFSCDFFRKLNGGRWNKSDSLYSGKSTYVSANLRNPMRQLVEWLMVYATGSTAHTGNVNDEKTCLDLDSEQNVYKYIWQADPLSGVFHCYRTSLQVDTAISPAFDIMDYDFANSTYSTWTESVYRMDQLRLFLVEQQSFEGGMLLAGLCLAVMSIMVVGRCGEETFIVDEGERMAEEGEPL